MNVKILTSLFLIIILLAMVSCEKTVTNVTLPDAKPKVVVFSYLSPDTDTIVAEVFYSRTINQPSGIEKTGIKDAQVIISDLGGQSVQLQYNNLKNNYFAPVNAGFLKENSMYFLEIKTTNGEQVQSVCVLPVQNASLRITHIDIDSTQIQGMIRGRFRVEFDDIAGKPDYYRIIARAVVRRIYDTDTTVVEYGLGFNYGEHYISVKDRDGETFAAETQVELLRVPNWVNEQLLGLKFYLLATDEHYYRFHRSLQNYVPDNPFSEPTIIYSNVDGGLGVFAGYNKYKLEYWLE